MCVAIYILSMSIYSCLYIISIFPWLESRKSRNRQYTHLISFNWNQESVLHSILVRVYGHLSVGMCMFVCNFLCSPVEGIRSAGAG